MDITSGDMTFSLTEALALMGFAQCVMILVYILFRVRYWRPAIVSIGYFLFLAAYFFLHLAQRLEPWHDAIRTGLYLTRAMGPPMCFLLVLQVAKPAELPKLKHFFILLVLPVIFLMASGIVRAAGADNDIVLPWSCAMAGAVSLLAIWYQRDFLGGILNEKSGREKYWLVISFIAINLLDVATSLFLSAGSIDVADADFFQILFGLVFVYLVSTTLFRVYPQPLQLSSVPRTKFFGLAPEDHAAADKIRDILDIEKLYQHPGFGRADLARAAGLSESKVSKIVGAIYGKSLPQLLIERRVEEAKALLKNPEIPVNVIAEESGFNSIATFNRVFRDVTGETPTEWRDKNKA